MRLDRLSSIIITLALAAIASSDRLRAEPRPIVPGALPPARDFVALPPISHPLVSPDGRWIAAQKLDGERGSIGLYSLTGAAPINFPLPDKTELRFCRWAGSGKLLIGMGLPQQYTGMDFYVTRLLVYNLATGDLHFVGDKFQGLIGDDVLWVDPAGHSILLEATPTIYSWMPRVRRIDLDSFAATTVQDVHGDVAHWFVDDAGAVRGGIGSDGNHWFFLYRRSTADKLEVVARDSLKNFDKLNDVMRIISGSDQGYALSSEKTGRAAVYRYDFKTRTLGELLYESPTNDITDFDISDDGSALKSASFTDDREHQTWFDPEMKAQQAAIDRAMPTTINRILSVDDAHEIMIVEATGSDEPGIIYVYRRAVHRLDMFSVTGATLRTEHLSPTEAIRYKARDGLEIPAYLTLPKGHPTQHLPLIVMPHGGPYGVRDTLGYDPEVQFLANRGYAVLQPNYRGSSSYGKSFADAGRGQVGRRMQDDLDDGIDWLAQRGTIDPKRVCIDGGSYGGYAALWGATRNPERYRCAISFAGISDMNRQLRYSKGFMDREGARSWTSRLRGDDAEFDLATVSPLAHVEELKVPVMLGFGDDDTTVPPLQSRLYVSALRKEGKAFEFYDYPGEGHGFAKPADLENWLIREEAFLTRYNPADVPRQ